MFKFIPYVTSGLTLAAFIVAAAVYAYRSWLLKKERLIRQAPEAERAQLVENALEFFAVDTVGLTREQRYKIAIQQIDQRAVRFRITAISVVTIAVLAAVVTALAIFGNGDGPRPSPSPTPSPLVHKLVTTPQSEQGPRIKAVSALKYRPPLERPALSKSTVAMWDLPHRDNLWEARETDVRQYKGIAGLLNPDLIDDPPVNGGWSFQGRYCGNNQDCGVPATDPNPDPQAELVFEFDQPASVEGLEIVSGAWGIKKLDIWVGDDPANLTYLGESTTACVSSDGTIKEQSSCWYPLPHQMAARFLKVKVKEVYELHGEFWIYRMYPEFNGKRFRI